MILKTGEVYDSLCIVTWREIDAEDIPVDENIGILFGQLKEFLLNIITLRGNQ